MGNTRIKKSVPLTLDIRDRLKGIVEQEIDRLPKLLEGLKDKERLDVILKLMPLIIPRVQSIHYSKNERGGDWTF